MGIDEIIATVEGVERNLRDRYNVFDWENQAAEQAAAAREGREYKGWYCNECGVDIGEYEDAGYDAKSLREVLEALRTLKAERESVGAER